MASILRRHGIFSRVLMLEEEVGSWKIYGSNFHHRPKNCRKRAEVGSWKLEALRRDVHIFSTTFSPPIFRCLSFHQAHFQLSVNNNIKQILDTIQYLLDSFNQNKQLQRTVLIIMIGIHNSSPL